MKLTKKHLKLTANRLAKTPYWHLADELLSHISALEQEAQVLRDDYEKLRGWYNVNCDVAEKLVAERDRAEDERIEWVKRGEAAEERCLSLEAERDKLAGMLQKYDEDYHELQFYHDKYKAALERIHKGGHSYNEWKIAEEALK